jgi:hypothetical protein
MSEVQVCIRDARRDIESTWHGSMVDGTIAALSAEPETIEELDQALARFVRPGAGSFFRGFHAGTNDQPYDAGLVIIDLAARLVVCTRATHRRDIKVRLPTTTAIARRTWICRMAWPATGCLLIEPKVGLRWRSNEGASAQPTRHWMREGSSGDTIHDS